MKYSSTLYLWGLMMLWLSACMPVKSVFLLGPDRHDLKRFPKKTIVVKPSDCFTFYKDTVDWGNRIRVNDWTKDIPFFVPLDELTKTHKVRSCVVIRNDSILYEYYGRKTHPESLHSSYSIAKSITSALIGIAIDEGHIASEKDLVKKYLPNVKAEQPYWEVLTIEHLLNHTSGIQYSLSLDATIYYGDNLVKGVERIKFAMQPGLKQHYINVNVQLLGLVLKAATQQTPAAYLQQKLWQPLRMCSDAVWSTDRKGNEKTFCCLGATALDYAKFGRLFLNEGNWNGQQIISPSWYQKSIARDTSAGSSFNYNYCWHIGRKEYGDYMAIGMYKQHIYINSKHNIIIVLLNDQEAPLRAERVVWWDVFRQIVDQL